jgi:hypothetical protein
MEHDFSMLQYSLSMTFSVSEHLRVQVLTPWSNLKHAHSPALGLERCIRKSSFNYQEGLCDLLLQSPTNAVTAAPQVRCGPKGWAFQFPLLLLKLYA